MARLAVRVQGGTGAGIREPVKEPAPDWTCANGHKNLGRWLRCMTPSCNVKRPKL